MSSSHRQVLVASPRVPDARRRVYAAAHRVPFGPHLRHGPLVRLGAAVQVRRLRSGRSCCCCCSRVEGSALPPLPPCRCVRLLQTYAQIARLLACRVLPCVPAPSTRITHREARFLENDRVPYEVSHDRARLKVNWEGAREKVRRRQDFLCGMRQQPRPRLWPDSDS